MKPAWNHVAIIFVICGIILFTNLGTPRLWDRDEPRNAGCAVEMMERGNWVVPTFNDELRHQKPVLLYWLIMSAYSIFGVSEFAARFWSAILAMGTVLATFGIGRRLFGEQIGFIASIVLASSTMFVVAGRAATPDSILIFCTTMALCAYVMGTFRKVKSGNAAHELATGCFPSQLRYVVTLYAMMGLAVLAKGPVGFVVPCAIIGMFMLLQRLPAVDEDRLQGRGWLVQTITAMLRPFHPVHFAKTVWAMRPITAGLIIVGISAPWYVLVAIQTEGDWTRMFLLNEHFGRATTAFENHRGGVWYYPLAILAGFFPWSIFAAPTLFGVDRQITRNHHWSKAMIFLICWVAVQVGIFTVVKTKLPSYVTPCYPALALLTAIYLQRLLTKKQWSPVSLTRLSFLSMIAVGIVSAGGLAFVGSKFLNGDYSVVAIGLLLIVGGSVAYWLLIKQRTRMAVTTMCVTGVSYATLVFGMMTVQVDKHQQSHLFLEQIRAADSDVSIATFGCLESSWVYYGEKPIHELRVDEDNESETTRSRYWHRKPRLTPEQFVAEHPQSMIIALERDVESLKSRLSSDYQVVETTPFFLRNQNLVLLSRPDLERTAQRKNEQTR